MTRYLKQLLLPARLIVLSSALAEPVILDSELASSYHFFDTYEVLIDAPPEDVWPDLLNARSWQYKFDLSHVSGPVNAEGEVLRIYEGEDFFMEISRIIPEKMIVSTLLPATMQDEDALGIGMLTLSEVDGKTLVSNFMARKYDWL